jgi:4-amino-4-deoxy-L-arabinose transferase-like glycosyltransferase
MVTRKLPAEVLIIIGAIILFVPFLGATHLFDWDEVNFAEASREMLVTSNYSIPQIEFQPFWEKPPLFFWLQVICMKIFGINEFASRFPNAVCGIITLLALYRIGKRQLNETFGWIWVFVYAGSLLPQFYFKSGIIDPWFNLFIFLSIYNLSQYSADGARKISYIIYAGLFTGMAVMTKGPVALLVVGLCYGIYALLNRFRYFMKLKHILLFILLTLLIGGLWFLALLLNGQQHVIIDFFNYQVKLFSTEDAGHGGPFYYHFIILLIGCFPAAALSILSMRNITVSEKLPLHLHKWMLILFWVVLLLFSIVKTKIVHYSSLCYYPLTFLAAISFYLIWKKTWVIPGWNKWLQFVTGFLLSVAIIGAASIEQWKGLLLSRVRIDDPFAKASLMADVHWTGLEIIPGIILLSGVLLYLFYSGRNNRKALLLLFATSMIAINGTIIMITPKVEPYSQGAMIEFFKDKSHERNIVETIRFKSYANLFYAGRNPDFSKAVADSFIHYDLLREIPVYYVGKIQNAEENEKENTNLQRLYSKNGFVFYKLKR